MKPTIAVASLAFAVACTGGGTQSTSSELSSSTGQSSNSSGVDRAAVEACFTTFQTCIDGAAADADVVACQDALKACLPAPPAPPDVCTTPPPRGDRPDGGTCDGDRPPPPPGGAPAGGAPAGGAPAGDGTQPPPPPDGANGTGGHRPPPPPPFVSPDGRIALATCHAKGVTCVASAASDADKEACHTTERQCAHDVISAAFTAFCADLPTLCSACSDSVACTDLAARCAAGLPADPPAPPPAR